jgi:Phage protein Gp138 N-terminal domain
MTSDYSPPSRNPADNDTLVGVMKLAFTKFLQKTDDMLPAKILAYNRTTNRAQVQPLIPVVTTSNQIVQRAQVASVPVFQYGGGGAVLSFPLTSGNQGWLKANDRDISLFKQTGKANPPNTQRKHSFEDGMIFPDNMGTATIVSEDANNAVFQNVSGTVRLALWPALFKFTAPQVTVGDTAGYTPTPGTVLDVQSTTQAFCPPRMTTPQRDAIPSPQEGFMIYNLTTHALNVYTNAGWP